MKVLGLQSHATDSKLIICSYCGEKTFKKSSDRNSSRDVKKHRDKCRPPHILFTAVVHDLRNILFEDKAGRDNSLSIK